MHTKTIGYFVVRSDATAKELRKAQQIAYAVNFDSFTIVIDRSGHAAMMRKHGLDRSDFSGGWIFPRQNKITFYSGTLGHITKDKDAVSEVVSCYLGVSLGSEHAHSSVVERFTDNEEVAGSRPAGHTVQCYYIGA